ncbi:MULTISPECIES: sodium-dependent transporter [unclassified Butyrivibrio]|uniref:sodium-dependent transporter n=1 Tax=unclassified Butyrivibrio TaxID=2639466 RepID=UPI0003B6CF6E|nr:MULTISPECIES: sodium-dependent transporter [unclassified Butyrivibrio]MDC7294783.1 sodium-dependent transporter [Butyrivibrio sp. DSM 10294]
MNERGSFQSRLGFILVSAGCAIGIGNVWKFPYVAGENGGSVFVLFYLIFLILMGIPVLTMELAMGRASGKTLVNGYKALEKEGNKWHIHGWVCMIGNYLLMMYYTTVSGWMVNYFFKFATGRFENLTEGGTASVFEEMLGDPTQLAIFTIITVLLGFGVLSFGVQNGLEKVNKVMMILLLCLIVILAIHSITLEGASEGIKFYLLPDMGKAKSVGIGKVITSAMSQAFFTLSVGMGSIEIFGSYMPKDYALTGEAIRICALDTFVAIISGLIIFPACFSYNIKPDAGPSLIFITLPDVFINMAGGRIWGTLFFLFMTFASFSTVTAVFENLVACTNDNFGWSRGKSIAVNCIFMLIASLPCVFGFNIWSDVNLIGARGILDSEDFLVSNLILPAGSLIFLLFCVTRLGWGFDNYIAEVNTGDGMKLPGALKWYLKLVLPVLILIIFIQGLMV